MEQIYCLKVLKNETLKQFLERNINVKSEKELKDIYYNEKIKQKNENIKTTIYKD